ncbi:glycoside hydrolase family 5 protein [Advenella sp. FME57]|uniref:glycoside hydrolase family 5 protein n=1 Tax=Advenella sp. FME57 TaxID=2742604 RepID=UPI001866E5EE|nr:cellulase family glycosylhydrolase [Advenella sp. FME57]
MLNMTSELKRLSMFGPTALLLALVCAQLSLVNSAQATSCVSSNGSLRSDAAPKKEKQIKCPSPVYKHFTTGLVELRNGKVLLRDGEEWYPKGMTFFGRLIPKGHKSDASTMYAQRNFGQKYMDALKWMGGDTVRLQIGMPFLDPKSSHFTSSYLQEVIDAVSLARRNGMTVILSMQWQERVNVPDVEKRMPGQSALRAWEYIAPQFSSDSGVLYELFNEPVTPVNPSRAEWLKWQNGHQAIVNMIREKGIHNVLIIEGPTMGKLLSEKYPIKDTVRQTAYGIHPRLRAYLNTPEEWDERFGNFANSHAVIATEWGHRGSTCKTANSDRAKEFIKYLEKKNIGLIGWGMETKSSTIPKILGNGRYQVSSYKDLDCNDRNAGPGDDMRQLFQRKTNRQAQITE